MKKVFTTHSEKETIAFAKRFASTLKGGEVITLQGDLGAGKTTFVKGLALGLEITNVVNSPTFVLMKVYPIDKGSMQLVHIDTYRVGSSRDLVEIGVLDYLGHKDTIVVVEWPEKITDLLHGKNVISLELAHDKKNQELRKIILRC